MYICDFFKKENKINIYPLVLLSLIFFFVPLFSNTVFAATLSISPSSGSYEVGSSIILKVNVTSDIAFNAVSSVINIPTSLFSIESVSKSGSALNFWVTEPTLSRSNGTVRFEGVALGGYKGGSIGNILTIVIRPLKIGSANISFQSGQILANDGEGTDITGNLSGAMFSIKEASVKPEPIKEIKENTPEVVPAPVIEKPLTLKSPEIVYGIKYNQPSIIGISDYSKAQVLITFISEKGTKIFITDIAEDNGNFNLPVPNSLKSGEYTVTAIMIKSDGTHSNESNKIIINIGNFFSDIPWQIWIILLILILIIVYLIIHIYTEDKDEKRKTNSNGKYKREMHKVEDIVHKSFDILREDIEDKSLLKKDINSAERTIGREIRDIEL